jgi:superfamily I DNA/RNA helicase
MMTLKEAIRQLQQRVLDVKEEGESVLAEENLDAVRIMSIHKSKGLEFPIVVLAGCHTGADGRRTADAEALFDWSTGLTGTRVGQIQDLAGLYIAEKIRLRAQEEQKRVLYVAMTRPRERPSSLAPPPAGTRAAVFSRCWTNASADRSNPPKPRPAFGSATATFRSRSCRRVSRPPAETGPKASRKNRAGSASSLPGTGGASATKRHRNSGRS